MSKTKFEAIYVANEGWLKTWLGRRLSNRADAADLAQDTFIKLLSSRHLADLKQPRDFLATVARGLLVDLFRRRSLERAYLDALQARGESVASSPHERAAAIETLLALDAMLAGLGRNVKMAFLWSQCDGLTYPQIASRLGISVRTVHTYIARAMDQCCRYEMDPATDAPGHAS